MNGIVYGIKDLSSDEIIYIGSTVNLYRRKNLHRCDCFTRQKDLLIYNYIREKTDREHFDECFTFEILYSAEFETRQELLSKEQEFIKLRLPLYNQCKAFQTHEELNEYHRVYNKTEKRREYKREYFRKWRLKKKLAQESKS